MPAPRTHRLPRRATATLVMVLENGDWVSRAAHWSPIQGGTGTNQTAQTTPATN